MATPRLSAAGGWPAVFYVLRKAMAVGPWRLLRRLRSKNACKTCALGMGGQQGGMTNERGHFPEVCKKSVQAYASDLAGVIEESFFVKTPIRALEQLSSAECERLGRFGFPLLAEAGDTHFRRIGWEAAFDRIAGAFQAARPEEVFFYCSGRASNEAGFLLQLVGRAYGTANLHNSSYYCHQASGVALGKVYGSGTASVTLEDLGRTDLAVLIGANPASNHPRLVSELIRLRRRGGRVLVINPLRELGLTRFRVPSDWRSFLGGSTVSDLYLQPRGGTDIALLKALLKRLIETGDIDHAFIQHYTTGWEGVQADIQAADLNTLLNTCGISQDNLEAAVRLVRQAKCGIFLWAMGLTHHAWGVDNILAVSNLALARGWLGRPGCGLLPVRGHSNVQGIGSVGVAPALKQAFADKLSAVFGLHLPTEAGLDTYASMEAAQAGRIKVAFLLGGNLYASNPDSAWAARAMRTIPLTVTVSTKPNVGHFQARGRAAIILPALARDEETQATTQESMFNYVRLSEGGCPAASMEMRSEVDIIATLAQKILPPSRVEWGAMRSHRHLREQMAQVVPGFQRLQAIDETREEFQIDGRTFPEPRFATPDQKAHFYVTPPPPAIGAGGETDFSLMTIRSEGQFNTVVFEEEDLYRGNTRRDVVMMSGADATRLQLHEGQRVIVKSAVGEMAANVAVVDIAPGCLAVYYPEANRLVPRKIDPRSKTPAFKSVAARIIPL